MSRAAHSGLLSPTSAPHGEAEDVLGDPVDPLLLLELLAEAVAWVKRYARLECITPALGEALLRGSPLGPCPLWAAGLVDVGLEENIELPTAAVCWHHDTSLYLSYYIIYPISRKVKLWKKLI